LTQINTAVEITPAADGHSRISAAARLSIVVPVALGLIFVLLFTTFGSIRQALLVFVNIPFALIGGVFALVVTGSTCPCRHRF
jgi:cobalt-zinc-cadmium resistance protein CzcA